jgi:hypothetical protein
MIRASCFTAGTTGDSEIQTSTLCDSLRAVEVWVITQGRTS